MARVTANEVRDILANTQLQDNQISAFIEVANLTVTERMTSETAYTDERLTKIELWLSAHLCTNADPRVLSESIDEGRTTLTYEGEFGQGLRSSRYGQMVLTLDYLSYLVEDTARRVRLRSTGKSNRRLVS